MKYALLALRLLWREGRSGELTVLFIALVIAVASSTTVSLFADRLQQTLVYQAAEFLAGDLVISSTEPLPTVWSSKAKKRRLKQAETIEFSSMLIENDQLLLAGIKAVSGLYPLRGHLKTTLSDFNAEQMTLSPPQRGEVWVEARILSALKLTIGDSLTIGDKKLMISAILTYEPDKRGNFYSLSPRVMMSTLDLTATRVIRAGSQVHYFSQFNGQESDLMAFKRWGQSHLTPSQKIVDIYQDRPELSQALSNTKSYLGISSVLVILISGIAIAMATKRYTARHFRTAAILRCLGYQQHQILYLYGYQFLYLGLFSSLIGSILGWFGQQELFGLLEHLLPVQVPFPSFFALALGFLTGLVILFSFALPPLLRLRHVSALKVLRHDLEPASTQAWIVYGAALSLISLLIGYYSEDLKLAASLLGGGLILLSLIGYSLYQLMLFTRKRVIRLPLHWRFGIQALLRHPQATLSQLLAFSFTLVAIILSYSISHDLLDDWQQQLPDKASNHFVLNIFPHQLETFKQDLSQESIQLNRFYPVVRGRLVKINDQPVQQIVSKNSQGQRAIRRDLSLTFSEQVPEDNQIVAGEWWQQSGENGQVSIEEKLAKSLGVHLGDKLTFTVGSQQFHVHVENIRKVRWETMKPNFYMIFSPKTLAHYPKTYLSSFYLPKENTQSVNHLVKKYPAMTLFKVDAILAQFKTILQQITQAVNYLLYFALLAGFSVLFAAVYTTLDQRIHEEGVMRTLGANRRLLAYRHLIEFSLLGFFAGLLAMIIAETLIFILYHFILHLEFHFHGTLWGLSPLIGIITVTFAGHMGIRTVIKSSPIKILQTIEK